MGKTFTGTFLAGLCLMVIALLWNEWERSNVCKTLHEKQYSSIVAHEYRFADGCYIEYMSSSGWEKVD